MCLRWQTWIKLAAALVSLWMRAAFPIHAIADAGFDDGLFLAMARNLGSGHWFGPFDKLTLAKGPFYPAFILFAFALHIPLKIAEHGAYLLASLVVCRVVQRSTPHRPQATLIGTVLFCLLCFNPVLWNSELQRVIREGLYISLTLASIGVAVAISVPAPGTTIRRTVVLGCGLGLLGGAFWLTREEGIWLAPSLLSIGALGLFGRRRRWRETLIGLLPWAGAALAMMLVISTTATTNWLAYGVFETNEFKSDAFRRAYGAIARIEPDDWQRYIVFPADARARAYAVSAAARELRPTLDGPVGEAWRQGPCAQFHISPCTGTHAGWFMWALRDAVAQAGHYTTAPGAAAFYNELATELNRACDEGQLPCLPPRATLMPPFRYQYVLDTLREIPALLGIVFGMGAGNVGTEPSIGSPQALQAVSEVVGPVAPASGASLVLHGWAATAAGAPVLRISREDGAETSFTLTSGPAPDVRAAHPDKQSIRFDITTECPPVACVLIIGSEHQADVTTRLSDLLPGTVLDRPDAVLFLDRVALHNPLGQRLNAIQVRLATGIAYAYSRLFPLLGGLAGIGLLGSLLVWRSYADNLACLALAVGCAVAVASRVVLLAYLEVTSIPSANLLYASPASAPAIVFTVLGLWLGIALLPRKRRA